MIQVSRSTINVGVVGCGVVGSGTCQILRQNAKLIERRVGAPVRLARVADRNLVNAKKLKIPKSALTKDGLAICTDPKINIVVELVGGMGVASKLIETALRNGKHVVTANKALLAEKGRGLFDLAEKQGLQLLFEAAVGGAIPVVRTIKQDLAGDTIDKVYGILNGTCNYILTQMNETRVDFADALREAQKLGYAEADPTLDIEGGDTAHKIALIAQLVWGTHISFHKIHVEGITQLSSADFIFAEKLDRVIKLIAVAKRGRDNIELRVNPILLPKDSTLARISGSVNAVMFHGLAAGELLLSGHGAGSLPTASAVVGDVVEAAHTLRLTRQGGPSISSVPNLGIQLTQFVDLPIKPIDEIVSAYYLRFVVKDQPGIIHRISGILTKYKLSIRDIFQLDLHEFQKVVPLAMILHPAREKVIHQARRELDCLSCMAEQVVTLRVE